MRVAFALAATVAVISFPAGAQTAPMCGSYAEAVAALASKYQESRVAAGVQGQGLMEFWSTPSGSTWTLILRMAGDRSCIVGAGEGWQAIEPVPVEEGGRI